MNYMNDVDSIQASLVKRAKLELRHSRTEVDVIKKTLKSYRKIIFSAAFVCLLIICAWILIIVSVKPFSKYPLHLTRDGHISGEKILYKDTNYGSSNEIEVNVNDYLTNKDLKDDDKVKVILDKDNKISEVITDKDYNNYIKSIIILIVGLLVGSIIILVILFIIERNTYGKYWHEYYKWWLHVGFYKTDRYIP